MNIKGYFKGRYLLIFVGICVIYYGIAVYKTGMIGLDTAIFVTPRETGVPLIILGIVMVVYGLLMKIERTPPLIKASSHGDTDKVRALLAKCADVNVKDKTGDTALRYAAQYGHTDIVRALLTKGADVNAKDNDGKIALIYAIKVGHNEIVRVLKEAGLK